MKRLGLIIALAACTGMLFSTASFASDGTESTGDSIALTFSNGSMSTSLDGESMQLMQNYVSEQTGGQITVDAHWQNSLFTQDQEIPALMKGNLDMCQAQPSQLAEYFPTMYTFTGAYCFKDYDHWKKFFESDTAQELFDRMEDELGITVLAVENFGARTISLTTDKKITSRADMKNIKLRVMNDESMIFMGEALGANPVPVAYSDVYLSLQTGTIDGQENVPRTIIDNAYYEVLKSITLNNHIQGTNFYIINSKKYRSLSEDQQKIVKEGARLCAEHKTDESQKLDDIVAQLKEKGMSVYELSDEELTNYSQEVKDYYGQHPEVTSMWDMDLYQKIQDMID